MTTGYHVTTPRKLARYRSSMGIWPPVRFWPTIETARHWARRTGRTVILEISVKTSHPLPDHKPARWSPDLVKGWSIVETFEPAARGEEKD